MDARPHDGHALELVTDATVFFANVVLTEEGHVGVGNGLLQLHKRGDESYLWCDTCQRTIHAGEDGLAEDWEER